MVTMPRSRPMPSIGSHCHELRINDETKTWRIFYRIDRDAIVIADVIDKKASKAPKKVIGIVSRDLGSMTMKAAKRKKLEAKGWKVGSADDFLGLSPEEVVYIEFKYALSNSLKERRTKEKLSQVELAKIVKTSQSRVAKMEAGDPSVSIDLLVRSLIALGASPKDLAKAIA